MITSTLAANEFRPVGIGQGRWLVIRSAENYIFLKSDNKEAIRVQEGDRVNLSELRNVQFENPHDANNQLVYQLSPVEITNQALPPVTFTGQMVEQPGNDNTHKPKVTIAAGQTALLCAANAARKEVRIALPSDAAGFINMGKLGVLADQGGLLEPGMVDYIATEGALYAHNPNADSVDVWVMEINRV